MNSKFIVLLKNSGNVLFLILIAVALFAALSYSVTQSMRGGSMSTESEQASLDEAVVGNYTANLNVGKMRLQMAGCASIDYTSPTNQVAGDKSCHMFHPDGANVAYLDFGDTCPDEDLLGGLVVGEACGLIVYAGSSVGYRLYTTRTDLGSIAWASGNTGTPATSYSDGLSNTNILVALADGGSPYIAANGCRALGEEWYLPAYNELAAIRPNSGAIGNFDTSGVAYWSSTEGPHGNSVARAIYWHNGSGISLAKTGTRPVRCVRRD